MAGLPSFLQSMFTPTGPPRQRVDQGGGEYTGSIGGVYEGDDSSPVFPRSITSRSVSGPTTRRLPDPLPGTGGGPSPLAQIGRDMKHLAGSGGDDGVDMTSITEVMQSSTPSPPNEPFDQPLSQIGNMSGGWADQGDPGMVSGPMFAPSEPSSLPSGPMFAPSESSTLQGPAGALRAGLTESQGIGYPTALPSYKPPHTQALDFVKRHTASLAPQAGVGQTDPATGVPALIGGDPLGEFLSKLIERGTGGGTPVPTPGIQPGQTDPALGVPAPIDGHWPEWLKNLVNPGRSFRATR